MKRYLQDKNVLAGLLFLVFDLFYLGFGLQIPVSDSSAVGAGFMPRVYGICMLVVALILLFTSVHKVKKEIEAEGGEKDAFHIEKADLLRVLCTFAVILLYVILLQDVGFLLCSVPLMFALVILLTPAHVRQDYIAKHCCDAKGNVKSGCQGAGGKVKFTAMLPYYGKVLLFALVYTIAVYILFAKFLGLKMPAGILKNVLPF